MNTHNPDQRGLPDDLHETFVRRADDLPGSSLSLGTVQARARRIRRNRRLAVAGGMAAALIVIVPAGMLATGNLDGRPSPAPPMSGGPSPTGGSPSRAVDPVPASGPALPYVQGGTLVLPGGERHDLPRAYQRVLSAGSELYGLSNNPDTGAWQADILDLEGSVLGTVDITQDVAVSADGNSAAWSTPDGDVVVRSDATNRTIASGLGPVDVQAVVDGAVYVNRLDGGGPQVVADGGATDLPGGPLKVDDATSDGLVAMQTKSTVDGSCSGVYDTAAQEVAFTTCRYSLSRFSPDGRYVSGSDAYGDGIGLPYVVILDARTGELVARYQPSGGFVSHLVWEDPDHLLMVEHDDQSGWSIVRFGTVEVVDSLIGPSRATDDVTPAYLLTGPQ